jgi:gluconokinase
MMGPFGKFEAHIVVFPLFQRYEIQPKFVRMGFYKMDHHAAVTALVLMGVSGCGKSFIGKLLGERLSARLNTDAPFVDGDQFHSAQSVQKMKDGVPLDDVDRMPWLMTVRDQIFTYAKQRETENGRRPRSFILVGCSALKKKYRDILQQSAPLCECIFIFLKGDKKLILERMEKRQGHFMKSKMLDSQFYDLEEPDAHAERVVVVDIDATPDAIVDQIMTALGPLVDN